MQIPDWQSADFPEQAFRSGWWAWRRLLSVSLWHRYYEYYRNLRCTIQFAGLRHYKKQRGCSVTARPKTNAALVIGNLDLRDGLSCGANYHLDQIRTKHSALTIRHVGTNANSDVTIEGSLDQEFECLYLLDPPSRYDRLLRQVHPARIATAHRVGIWVRESNYLPAFWLEAATFLDEIWTPSSFSADLLRNRITSAPIVVVPHAANRKTGVAAGAARLISGEKVTFNGLAVMDLRGGGSRKNPWAVIAAWQEAFGSNPDCQLTMKVQFSRQCSIVHEELLAMIGSAGNIRLLDAFLPQAQLDSLMDQADVFISLHRSEGYGLPVEETLMRGVPVVATDWSATTEFARSYDNYYPVNYRLLPSHEWSRKKPGLNFKWAEADIESAAQQLGSIYEAWKSDPL